MDPTHALIATLIAIDILAGIIGVLFLSRDLREISHIQRALFLMLRRQYGDIDQELKEIHELLKAQ
jgi:hypothetical protein